MLSQISALARPVREKTHSMHYPLFIVLFPGHQPMTISWGGSPGMISPVPRPPANDNKLGGNPGMISLLLLRAMFSWEEYSHGKHRLLDMCRYMFACYQTFPGAFLGKFQVQYQVYVAWYTAQYFYMQVQQLTFPKYISMK